jgi:hypothetical protein
MSDILKIINDLTQRLWAKYGNTLERKYSQEEIHLTYYAGEVLRKNGHEYKVFNGETFYTEKAMHAAFIAGFRVGLKEAYKDAKIQKIALIDELISELQSYKDNE